MGNDVGLVRATGVAAAVLLWLEQIDNVASSAIKGSERFGHAARLEILGKSVQVALAMAATWRWPNLDALYLALAAGAVLRMVAKLLIARRVLGIRRMGPTLRNTASVLHFARWGWLQGIGSVLFGVADRMLVGSVLGATSLAYYSIASQLAMQVHAISAAGLSVIFPMVSRRLEGREQLQLWPLARLTMSGNLLLSTSLAISLLVLGPLILDPWVGPAAAAVVRRLLPWLVGAYWLLAVNVVPFYILLGMGRIRFVGLAVLGAGAAGVAAMFLSVTHLGLAGAPAGRGVYAFVSLALLLPVTRHLWHERGQRRKVRPRIDPVLDHEPVP